MNTLHNCYVSTHRRDCDFYHTYTPKEGQDCHCSPGSSNHGRSQWPELAVGWAAESSCPRLEASHGDCILSTEFCGGKAASSHIRRMGIRVLPTRFGEADKTPDTKHHWVKVIHPKHKWLHDDSQPNSPVEKFMWTLGFCCKTYNQARFQVP